MSVFWERDEANWARHEAKESERGECYQHHWQRTRWGGVCVQCGETVSEGEL